MKELRTSARFKDFCNDQHIFKLQAEVGCDYRYVHCQFYVGIFLFGVQAVSVPKKNLT